MKKLEIVLRRYDLVNLLEFVENDCKIGVAQFDDLSFMRAINEETDYEAILDPSTDYIIIRKH